MVVKQPQSTRVEEPTLLCNHWGVVDCLTSHLSHFPDALLYAKVKVLVKCGCLL
jgi:hypothetical protein